MMEHIIFELVLICPYYKSFDTLLEFCNIWSCIIRSGGTSSQKAIISMPSTSVKQIFKCIPEKGVKYGPPKNAEKFIESFKVIKIDNGNCNSIPSKNKNS